MGTWLMTSDQFGDLATLGIALATVGLIFVALWAGNKAARDVKRQIGIQRKTERRRRVFDHQGTLNAREFVEMTAEAVGVIDMFKENLAGAEHAWTHTIGRGRKLRILAVFNFYELLATEYNAKILHRPTADLSLAYAAVAMWSYAEPFLEYLRLGGSAYYAQWKYMYDHYGGTIVAKATQTPE